MEIAIHYLSPNEDKLSEPYDNSASESEEEDKEEDKGFVVNFEKNGADDMVLDPGYTEDSDDSEKFDAEG